MPFFGALFGFLASAVGKQLLNSFLFFVALKAFLISLFVLVLPVILNNWIHGLVQVVMDTVNNYSAGSGLDGAMAFTGILAWLVDVFRIPECVAVLVSALQLHLVLRIIPFSPVR